MHGAAPSPVDDAFARTRRPPYRAVILTSPRTRGERGCDAAAARMAELAAQPPGCLGVESMRDANGVGSTVSCRDSEDASASWRREIEHTAARERGRIEWYGHYGLRVANVERAYGKKKHTA